MQGLFYMEDKSQDGMAALGLKGGAGRGNGMKEARGKVG
jgi:hypothetical protein